MINQCEDFHNKVVWMLTQGILRIKYVMSRELLEVGEDRKIKGAY